MVDPLQDALQSLPHGPEFRFVDRLLSLVPGQRAAGEYVVREDAYYLRGHLPGEPLLPGVLLVEAVAQMAGIVAQNDPAFPAFEGLRLTALRAVKILGTARPGETVRLEAAITGRLGHLVQAKATASVAGLTVLSAQLTLSGQAPRPTGAPPPAAGLGKLDDGAAV
jgi:3-hydroxyacyl-[acyl-carrier-protein] dehydratase